jgi:hypothetical protein
MLRGSLYSWRVARGSVRLQQHTAPAKRHRLGLVMTLSRSADAARFGSVGNGVVEALVDGRDWFRYGAAWLRARWAASSNDPGFPAGTSSPTSHIIIPPTWCVLT